jgi:hypothetical protein
MNAMLMFIGVYVATTLWGLDVADIVKPGNSFAVVERDFTFDKIAQMVHTRRVFKYTNNAVFITLVKKQLTVEQKTFWPNGNLRFKASFSLSNLPVGTWEIADSSGKIIASIAWSDPDTRQRGEVQTSLCAHEASVVLARLDLSIFCTKGGKKTGYEIRFSTTGAVLELGLNLDDQKVGLWQQWYRDGKPSMLSSWLDNKLSGTYQFLDPHTGWPILEGRYEEGFPVGTWIYSCNKKTMMQILDKGKSYAETHEWDLLCEPPFAELAAVHP